MTAKLKRIGVIVLTVATGIAASTRAQQKAVPGFKIGPKMDKVVPRQFIVDPPTLENLGFRWYIEGDSNRNASVAVAFRRQGTSQWKEALPMLRVHHEVVNQKYGPWRVGNLFAGSVLFLEPGTGYEVRFTMSDPDGGAPADAKIVKVSTRSEPKAIAGARIIRTDPEKGLMPAYEEAKPGDVILLEAGVYRGPFELKKSGTVEKPIVFRRPSEGEAVLEGGGVRGGSRIVTLNGTNHLHFEGLTFRGAQMAIYAAKPGGAEGLVVRRCKIHDVVYGINTGCPNSKDWYIADNEIIGINPTWYPRPPKTYMSPGHTGVNVYGRGHVICYNRITRFSDSTAIYNFGPPVDDLAKHCVNIDFYNNDLSFAQDDTFEADYGCHNVRFYRNRCYNTHTGMSTQPFYGGPVYLIRNEVFGITTLSYKLNNYPAGILAYNNTSLCAGTGFRPPPIWQNGHFRNNLFMSGKYYSMETGSPTAYSTMDYNAYRRNEPDRFLKWIDHKGKVGRYQSIEELFKATGLEEHGVLVDYDIFVRGSAPEQGKTCEPGDYDLRLRKGANVVDAGIALPQITDGFYGKAPDLGCYEIGGEVPHYGPRPNPAPVKYEADWESLDKRQTPQWWVDSKFGLLVCWGFYSVPAWAVKGQYAEWYWARVEGDKKRNGPWWRFHKATYGEDFDCADFAAMFKAELFDAGHWAKVFKDSGAKYVVLTAKYHDGFCLWQSEHANKAWGKPWNSVEVGPKRDLLKELGDAVRGEELRMGIYYSLYEWYNPLWLADRKRYVDKHMLPQMKEVVSRYKPAVIFADGEWDMPPDKWRSEEFLAWLYNESPVRDEVVVNDRWGKGARHKHGGYYTTEYGAGMVAGGHAWEENRGMGYSYGYSRAERLSDYRSGRELVLMLVDFVSRGGNFLLDVGPTADGRIPVIMEQRLAEMGRWLKVNGEAIYGTRPWRKSVQWSEGERPKFGYGGEYRAKYDVRELTGEKGEGKAVVEAFFTSRGDTIYAITPTWPGRKLTLKGVGSTKETVVTMVGLDKPLEFEQIGEDIAIELPRLGVGQAPCEYAYVLRVSDVK